MKEDVVEELGDFAEKRINGADIFATFSLVDALNYFNTKKVGGMVTLIIFRSVWVIFIILIITTDC